MHDDGCEGDAGVRSAVISSFATIYPLQCSRRNVDGLPILPTFWEKGLVNSRPGINRTVERHLVVYSLMLARGQRGHTLLGIDEVSLLMVRSR